MKIILVVGARPNFMKIAPIIREFKRINFKDFLLVHTEQHYDYEMSKVFFDELELPVPDYFLNTGSGTHAEQTAKVMVEFEKVCFAEKPDIVIVVGDVNSTLACSIVSKKLDIKLAHVEAGLRSNDMTMPEEVNRILTDAVSDFLFVSEESGLKNLKNEGKKDEQIFFVGNVMIDNLYYYINKMNTTKNESDTASLKEKYGVVTLHRPSNIDIKSTYQGIIEALIEISRDMPLVFPIHPRSRKNMESFGLLELVNSSNIKLQPPLSYIEFLELWKDANIVFTDSGGIQEETTALGVPCFTLRKNTERPITVDEGTNTLVGNTKETIIDAYSHFKMGKSKQGRIPELWDGKSAKRIVDVLLKGL